MKLLRYGPAGQERPGILDSNGLIRSLWPAIGDITPEILHPEGLQILAAINPENLPLVSGKPRIGAPVAGVRQLVAVGLNYRKHAEEAGMKIPDEPMVFTKAITSLSGPDDDIVLPMDSVSTDWEVELGVVIGQAAYQVSEADALSYVAGYCTANDVSERAWQLERGGQFVIGKSAPGFAPIGPWLVTKDEVPDPQDLELTLQVNGRQRQRSSTNDMIFGVARALSYITGFLKLLPGDVVLTGTPSGVGLGMTPRTYLKPGDVVTTEVIGLGRQQQKVRLEGVA
ncbi:fumarylacetoacetate hydrolase family protein [Cupriavidus basilensis]|uniref:fumarylacetoacetate hydrolase family protein n=1 Tax=Cupriavidus basilensis TaxID=68895 RepID=UPI0005BCED52|nr:fumarylacetoacetate hydrolase family protein [Cupriavidus basilensis]